MTTSLCPEAENRPEERLLLYALQAHLDSKKHSRLRSQAQEELDWDYVLESASRHGVMPLLYSSLSTVCPEAVPQAILPKLEEQWHANIAWNLLLTSELLKILSLFEAHGIVAVPYKGPTLAHLAYGHISRRQFIDLDILVDREHLPQAKDLLHSIGYGLYPPMSPSRESAFLRSQYHYGFVEPVKKVLVEMHCEITPSYLSVPLNLQKLRSRLRRRRLAGQEIYSLPPEELLLIICVHAAKHFWGCLSWICDAAAMIAAHPEMNWQYLMDLAEALGAKRMLFLGLFLANAILEVPLSGDLRQTVEYDPVVRSLARRVQHRLFPDNRHPPSIQDNFSFFLQIKECWRDKIRYCLHIAFTPSVDDWASMALLPAFSCLYYPIRPFRLLSRYRKSVLVY
jgi:hypothetical protein